jgi:proteasome accessory factor C
MTVKQEAAPERLSRLLSLVPWLTAHDGVSVHEAATHFGVTEEQLEKDLWLLVCCGLPGHGPEHLIDIQFWDEGGRIHVIDPQTLATPVQLSADESVSLLLGLRILESLPGSHDRTAISELMTILTNVAQEYLADGDRWVLAPEFSEQIRSVVDEAMSTGAALQIEYHAATKDELTQRTVLPTEISVVNGRALLHAWCLGAQAPRTFRLDRIVHAECTSGPDTEADPAVQRDPAVTSPSASPTPVRLSLEPTARWLVDTYGLNVSAELPDGGCEVDWEVWNQAWLIRQVIEWGGSVEILSPASWRTALLSYNDELLEVVSAQK